MPSFISPTGEIVRTKTPKDFALKFGFSEGCARALSCGYRARLNGWCSTHKRAKKHRDRFTTVLINTQGTRTILGPSIRAFCRKWNLNAGELGRLLAGQSVMYRGWCLEKTWEIINAPAADRNF